MGILFAFAHAISWGGTSVLLRPLSARLNPLVLNGVRCGFALLLVMPLIWLTGGMNQFALITGRDLLFLWGSVILGGVIGDACYVASLNILGVSRAFPIANCYPVATMLFSLLFLGATFSTRMILGTALVLVGIYFVARPPADNAPDALPRDRLIKGVLVALAANLAWGLHAPVLALGLEHINGLVATSVRIPVVVAIALGLAAMRGHTAEIKNYDRHTWTMLVITGVLGWGVAGTLQALGVQYLGPSKTAVIAATAPLFAMPLSMIFLHERPTRLTWVGTALTVVGLALVV